MYQNTPVKFSLLLNRDKSERRLGEGMKENRIKRRIEIKIKIRIRSRREDHSTVTAIRNGAE